MKNRYIIAAAAGVAAGAFIGAEMYLRHQDHLYNRDRWFHEEYDGSHPYKVFHNKSGWELMPGYHVAGIRINQYGFRGEDFAKRKTSGVQRIMCLGDACTFGPPGDESPYPYQLQQCLEAMELAHTYQTINAGVEGHASINALLRLPRLLTFKPDILIVYLGWSDMWNSNPKRYPDRRRKPRSYWHYGNYADGPSMVLATVKEALGLTPASPPVNAYDLKDFIPVNFEYNMRELIQTGKHEGARVVLTTLPTLLLPDNEQPSLGTLEKLHYPTFIAPGDTDSLKHLYNAFDRSIRQLAMMEDVDLIDLNTAFDRVDKPRDLFFFDTWHPTTEGHQVIGRALAEGLLDREIVG